MNGVQYAKKVQTSRPRLLRSRATCFTPCLVNVPMHKFCARYGATLPGLDIHMNIE